MLRIFAENTEGEVRELPNLNSLILEREEGVAGDLLTLSLEGAIFSELVSLTVFENSEEIFTGLIDEQNVVISERETTQLVARSLGARLIDNEAKPQSFHNPDMKLIFERYARPFGIEEFLGENKAYMGEFRVQKGMSCYKVLEEFCSALYGVYPRIEGRKLVLERPCERIAFSNRSGIPFLKLSLSKLRVKPVSQVRVKVKEDGDYDTVIKNSLAINRKIRRERYFNGAPSTGKSIRTVFEAIKRSNASDTLIKVTSPVRLTHALGYQAEVFAEGDFHEEKLYVSSLRYSLSGNRQSTEIMLKKENNYVDNSIYE